MILETKNANSRLVSSAIQLSIYTWFGLPDFLWSALIFVPNKSLVNIGGADFQLLGIIISEQTTLRMDFQNRPGAKTGGGGAATQGMADRFLRSFKRFSSANDDWCWLFFSGRGESGWRRWRLKPSTLPRTPILWGCSLWCWWSQFSSNL